MRQTKQMDNAEVRRLYWFLVLRIYRGDDTASRSSHRSPSYI